MSDSQLTYSQRLEQATATARTAQILRDGERPEFAVLRYDDFQALIETLEDLTDALALSEARREDDGERIPLDDVLREFAVEE